MLKKINKRHSVPVFLILSHLLIVSAELCGQESASWVILLNQSLQADDAINVALNDLEAAGLKFAIKEDALPLADNTLIIGNQHQNRVTKELIEQDQISLKELADEQSYEIVTTNIDSKRVMIISGGSILGDVYGLYWLWDRLKVFPALPDINVFREPALKIRFAGGENEESMRNALRHSATWISAGITVNQLVPWQAEPEASTNEKNRQEIRSLIHYAHSLHLKFFLDEDEFSYHPSLLEEFDARPTPSDPAFWDAVQAKYRRLFRALPEIDGVRIRTGESTRIGGNCKALDVMHDGENCDWSLAKRYRTYVKKMYKVVVGEFDKIYVQRTWVTSAHEQHSIAEVYKEIFTDDVPVRNLYLSPYLSATDRYLFQPFNPTFNLTPHNMVVLLATLDYHGHSGVNICPTFPGQYFQAGLKLLLLPKESNVKGVHFGIPAVEGWNSASLTAYTVFRLAWNPEEDVAAIAHDFVSRYFGQAAVEELVDILLSSARAYKYGLYIEPVAYGDFNSLPHLRLTTFPAKGFPRLDSGKEHIAFLNTIYWRCLPWRTETLLYLDFGLKTAESMLEKSQSAVPLISDRQKAEQLKHSLELTYWLIKTNNLYVKTFFAYFLYRDVPTTENKQSLQKYAQELSQTMKIFAAIPGCIYRLDGMEQLLINVEQALTDLNAAEKKLANAPDNEGIKRLIAQQQSKAVEALNKFSHQAVKFLTWQGRVDGMDLLHIAGDKLKVEHLRFDDIAEMDYQVLKPLPKKKITVLIRDIQARSFRPFVLEQPDDENDFTATIFLSDFPEHGYSWWKFELYYILKSPEELGLTVPWD